MDMCAGDVHLLCRWTRVGVNPYGAMLPLTLTHAGFAAEWNALLVNGQTAAAWQTFGATRATGSAYLQTLKALAKPAMRVT